MSDGATTPLDHALVRRTIDAHFAARGATGALAQVGSHLESCGECRGYFSQRELLARLDPRAASAKERIAASVGIALPSSTPPLFTPLRSLSAVASAGALAAVLVVATQGSDDDGFTARGSGRVVDTDTAPVRAFRIVGDEAVAVGDAISPDDELAFTYRNPEAKSHLMIFAVDDRREVYWYHPAWTDPESDPAAVAVAPGEGFRELPEAVRHDLRSSTKLRVYAYFTDGTTTVRAVERALADQGAPPVSAVLVTELSVRPTR